MTPQRITIVELPMRGPTIRRVSPEEGRQRLADAKIPMAVMLVTDEAIASGAHIEISRSTYDFGATRLTSIAVRSAQTRLHAPLRAAGFRRQKNHSFIWEQ